MKSDPFKGMTVLSLEQALAMPYCTYRLGLLGMRVIRIEAPRGDPNRYVGQLVAEEEGMRSYYLGINANKESVTLNLKAAEGRALLHELVAKLQPDIFCTNQLPAKYEGLGIDFETLKGIHGPIIWCGLSGFGPERSEAAYDPMVQALSGLLYVTGEPEGDPMQIGVPLADLGAANESFTQIMIALLNRERTGEGSRIDISMARVCLSLLATKITPAALGADVSRFGNTHRFFSPVNVFQTADGFVMIAVGNDRQWKALVGLQGFEALDRPEYEKNAGRIADVKNLNTALGAIMRERPSGTLIDLFLGVGIPISPVSTIDDIFADPFLSGMMMKMKDPRHGTEVPLAPAPFEAWDSRPDPAQVYPPRLGEHNPAVFGELLGHDVSALKEKGII
ncbi:MAG: CaiB/BaiF CoA transferase family protein [Planctomycetota bacterium]|jgi:formyl-CoA transferase